MQIDQFLVKQFQEIAKPATQINKMDQIIKEINKLASPTYNWS